MAERKILVLLDGTQFRKCVLPHVQRLFPPGENTLILMGVVSPPDMVTGEGLWVGPVASVPTYIPYGPATRPEEWAAAVESYRQQLEEERPALEAAGYTVAVRVDLGDVVETIAEVATREQVDVVALATHARSGFSRLVLGSVAQDVVHRLHIPVLLVHPEHDD